MGIEGLRSLSHSELVDTTLYTTHVHRSSLSIPSQGSTVRLPGAPVLPKKERKKTDNPREGWEDGTPPPHRDFKERGVMR